MSLEPLDKFTPLEDEFNVSEEDAILRGLEEVEEEKPKADEPKQEEKSDKEREKELEDTRLLEVFDTILFEGEYRETIKISPRYSVTFRSRTVGESNDITRQLDSMGLQTVMAVRNFANVITLSYALVDINGVSMVDMSVKDKYSKVKTLPEGLIVILSNKLKDFDTKVAKAMEVGSRNF